jgi:hypothetical protein
MTSMITYPTAKDLEKAKKDSIHTLQQLYSVVVALALTHAMLKLGEIWPTLHSTEHILKVTAIGIAFLSTIVPFYHGMNRHLYETHIRNSETGEHGHPIPLLIDIFVFILESGLLFAMGRTLDSPTNFLLLWGLLLLLDIVWSVVVYKVQKGAKPKWAVNNLAWLTVVLIGYFALPQLFENMRGSVTAYGVYLLAVAEVSRSIVDYYLNWYYYFPWTKKPLR